MTNLSNAHQGYIYQDVLAAYFMAGEIAAGRKETSFLFDVKDTYQNITDRFDDIRIFRDGAHINIQVKYSNEDSNHSLTKADFSADSNYGLGLYELFKTWTSRQAANQKWRVCLAWRQPDKDDPINDVLIRIEDGDALLSGTSCYKFDIDKLWPVYDGVIATWRSLKQQSQNIERNSFQTFLEELIIELECPRTTLLEDFSQGVEKLLAFKISRIGIGIYPNDHLTTRQVAERLCTLARNRRSQQIKIPTTCNEAAEFAGINQSNGGIEQSFPIDERVLVETPNRLAAVLEILNQKQHIVLSAEPGAGKSWFIENLMQNVPDNTKVIRHYCYVDLEDPQATRRITANVMYGNLISQILDSEESLHNVLPYRYGSNLEQLNLLLKNIQTRTILIVDGIDHIGRIYQRNRADLKEGETTIIKAISQLDRSNPLIQVLVISQPIHELDTLGMFQYSLPPITEDFITRLLVKNGLSDVIIDGNSLASAIHRKSNGNALYAKYLMDHALNTSNRSSFAWLDKLPAYDFNLTSYYTYLNEQLDGEGRVPNAFAGANFSLTTTELSEITFMGSLVNKQLNTLLPILKFNQAAGYSIYHESFKRFIIDTISSSGASVKDLIYVPIIQWLKTKPLFQNPKAYDNLLELYLNIDDYTSISKTISVDFIENSLYNGQALHSVRRNHLIQRACLEHVHDLSCMIIVTQQASIIYELNSISSNVLVKYLLALQSLHDDHAMYRVLHNDDHLLVSVSDALKFLAHQARHGSSTVHWTFIPEGTRLDQESIGPYAVKLLHSKQFEKFDELATSLSDRESLDSFFRMQDDIAWWSIYQNDDWQKNTPKYKDIIDDLQHSSDDIDTIISKIMSDLYQRTTLEWYKVLHNFKKLCKTISEEKRAAVIIQLKDYNWYRNWLVYILKVEVLSEGEPSDEEIVEAFSYLVRDLDPFKGSPRASDLYSILPDIKRSFHEGLALCKGKAPLLFSCCEILEKVTQVTTSFQRSFSGPLTDEEYLELIQEYLPAEYVVDKYSKYYEYLKSRRTYSDVAGTAFDYVFALGRAGRKIEAESIFKDGVRCLTAYGERKDRSFSEILECSAPYQKAYGSLSLEWFWDLYRMSMTVVTHTDGKSTSGYPIEWFKEYFSVFPKEAVMALACETLENNGSRWHQEAQFLHLLESESPLLTPEYWFLLCRSLPLANSEAILERALSLIDKIPLSLQDVYLRWIETIPYAARANDGYSQHLAKQFEDHFGSVPKISVERDRIEIESPDSMPPVCPARGWTQHQIVEFIEIHGVSDSTIPAIQASIEALEDKHVKEEIIEKVAGSFRSGRGIPKWVETFLDKGSPEWIYFNVSVFIYATDGWFRGLIHTDYLERAYNEDPELTLALLRKILGHTVSRSGYDYYSLTSNLIKGLCIIKLDEGLVHPLLKLAFELVDRRLPFPPQYEINSGLLQGLEDFNPNELAIAILISRLKTLTTERTQAIIWSLASLSSTNKEILIKPILWSLRYPDILLPIQRSLLLQVLSDISVTTIEKDLRDEILTNYPSKFFLENQLIRRISGSTLSFPPVQQSNLSFTPHPYDVDFFPYMHPKYNALMSMIGPLEGSFNAYAARRDALTEAHESYFLRVERLQTPTILTANAAYEIVNSQYYNELVEVTDIPGYNNIMHFFIPEIISQVGSVSRRPTLPPSPMKNPVNVDASETLQHGAWTIIAYEDKEILGDTMDNKQHQRSNRVLGFDDSPEADELPYARTLLHLSLYQYPGKPDQPICKLSIEDTLEKSNLLFVTPWVLEKLQLRLCSDLHNGLRAVSETGDVVIKTIVWKEERYGEVNNGTEVPRRDGVAVLISSDWYRRLLELYEPKGYYAWLVDTHVHE